jgi:hypothetical protein
MADLSLTPVAGQIKPVQGASLADMISLARGAQAYQQAQQINPIELETAQQQLSRLQQLTPQEIIRATAEANVAKGTEAPRITSSEQAAQTATVGTESAKLDFANKQVNAVAGRLTSLINNPLIITAEQNPQAVDSAKLMDVVRKYGEEQASSLGIPKDKADQLLQPYLEQTKNPAGIRQFLKDKLLSTLDQGSRLTAMQPSGQGVNTGAGGYTVQTGQFGPYVPGQILPGTAFEQQVPPTQGVVNPQTGATELLGTLSQRKNQPIVTGLGPAQSGVLEAGGSVIKEDLPRTIAEAKDAPQRIGIFQNIKKLAPESFTGPTAERRQAVASFAQMLGIPAYTLETSSTDELMKNTKLLQMAGGNTDAARALAEFANPNSKMTKEGISRVTDQLLGIEKMRLARANYLVPAQNDANAYMQRKSDFDSISDGRLFQEMTKDDAQKMWNSMSKEEQTQIKLMRDKARQLGVLK